MRVLDLPDAVLARADVSLRCRSRREVRLLDDEPVAVPVGAHSRNSQTLWKATTAEGYGCGRAPF